ncbi:MAG: ketol-acid reductoisomerase [Candidatus Dormibacteraeota bacterium]|nr:ketol-acid reductoisomerase [Candidatus Dormibacteraeota bacterium]MBV9525717.1 ketol-acid reductoisomerase [Candidatus Dormibacteraeota bacterium]
MTATMYYDADADPNELAGTRIAVLGYGSQGHAHALNLRDSGFDVCVGLPEASVSREAARAEGLRVLSPAEACAEAGVIVVLTPDTGQRALYDASIRPHLAAGDLLVFAHGFNIRYGLIEPPAGVDVTLVAPKGPGHLVRSTFVAGQGVPCLMAVHQDATGRARSRTLAYARGIGGTRAGVLTTTFAEETETDLFGEQAVLCGGVSSLVKAGFETLVAAGYQPELAYFEVMHELKLIVDLMYRGGLSYMRYSVSDTAEYGDYVSGPRVIDDRVRATMRQLLDAIRDGSFAQRWIAENDAGRPYFDREREAERAHPIEDVGAQLRSRMRWLDAQTVPSPRSAEAGPAAVAGAAGERS